MIARAFGRVQLWLWFIASWFELKLAKAWARAKRAAQPDLNAALRAAETWRAAFEKAEARLKEAESGRCQFCKHRSADIDPVMQKLREDKERFEELATGPVDGGFLKTRKRADGNLELVVPKTALEPTGNDDPELAPGCTLPEKKQ